MKALARRMVGHGALWCLLFGHCPCDACIRDAVCRHCGAKRTW